MAAADTNVRPGRQAPAANARGARRSRLARLLLQSLELLQLDRKLLLLLASSLMPACIIPIGPDWQDPPGEANSRPRIVSVAPPLGSIVSATPTGTTTFRFTITDDNPQDDIHFRWLAEYPGFVAGTTHAPPPDTIQHTLDGELLREERTFPVSCVQLSTARTTHQIMAAIWDRAFVESSSGADVLTTVDGELPIQLSWTLEQSCIVP